MRLEMFGSVCTVWSAHGRLELFVQKCNSLVQKWKFVTGLMMVPSACSWGASLRCRKDAVSGYRPKVPLHVMPSSHAMPLFHPMVLHYRLLIFALRTQRASFHTTYHCVSERKA